MLDTLTHTPAQPLRPWSRFSDGAATVVFWSVLGLLVLVREIFRTDAGEPFPWAGIGQMFAEMGVWALVTPLVFWMVLRWPVERGAWVSHLALHLGAGLLIAFAVEYVTRGIFRPLFTGPVRPERAWTFAGSFMRLRMLDEVIVFFAVLAAGHARAAMFQVHERRVEAERLLAERTRMIAERAHLEAQLAQARLSALRMQLNPHFLFNTLNAISALVEDDPSGVRTMIARLSSLLRRVLSLGEGVREMPLRAEAAFLRDYLDVQRIRLQDRLRVEEAWDSDTLDALVPPLVLQPLVENAIGHGIAQKEDIGTIRLSSMREAEHLTLLVEDDGPGLAEDADSSGGVGIANTRERLHVLYGDAASLTVTSRSQGGVVARVVLPCRLADASVETMRDRALSQDTDLVVS